jgi:dCMP deaminase
MSKEQAPQPKGHNDQNDINLLISKDSRLNWDEYFITIALLASKRSSCSRLHVGCVITKNNRILATGYNGFLPGAPHISRIENNHEQFTVHAEQNSICDAAYRGVSLNNSIAYITHYPCLNCLKLLIASGIKNIKYLYDYKNNPLTKEMIIENNISVSKIEVIST